MMPHCNVCGSLFTSPIYQSPEDRSLTSMSTLIEGRSAVFFCEVCGHLQTTELPNLQAYYQHEYEINIKSDEDDQIYQIINGRPIYRADHQAETLMAKLELKPGDRVLDYGCAKASTLRKVLAYHPYIQPFLFDVTDKYIHYWQRYPKLPQWSVHQPNPAWQGTMDVVLSFYALEHIADLRAVLTNVRHLLRPCGLFYFIVPNVYKNPADFIVADHINHFSNASLRWLLAANGFDRIDIDEQVHDAAYVVMARLADQNAHIDTASLGITDSLLQIRTAAHALAMYWQTSIERIRQYESCLPEFGSAAIYGAGFYGYFIAHCLSRLDRICCFIDQNPHLQGTAALGRPVLAPEELPAQVTHMLVGLNPRHARSVIGSIAAWRMRSLDYFYL